MMHAMYTWCTTRAYQSVAVEEMMQTRTRADTLRHCVQWLTSRKRSAYELDEKVVPSKRARTAAGTVA